MRTGMYISVDGTKTMGTKTLEISGFSALSAMIRNFPIGRSA